MNKSIATLLALWAVSAGAGGCQDQAQELQRLKAENAQLRAEVERLGGNATPKERSPDAAATAPKAGTVKIEILKVATSFPPENTDVALRVENLSEHFLGNLYVQVHAYGANERYLGDCLRPFLNLSAGKKSVDSCALLDVRMREIKRLQTEVDHPVPVALSHGTWNR